MAKVKYEGIKHLVRQNGGDPAEIFYKVQLATIEDSNGDIISDDKITNKEEVDQHINAGHDDKVEQQVSATDHILAKLNQEFALISVGGKLGAVILEQVACVSTQKPLEIFSLTDIGVLIKRRICTINPEANGAAIFKEWQINPNTKTYTGVEMNPSGTTTGHLNLWRGLSISPAKGKYDLIKEFLLIVVCNGDETLCIYLVKWIAHMIQKPWEKPGVSILLLGGQGTGKGTFAGKIIGGIHKHHFLHLQTDDAITGSFNSSLESSYLIFADEAFFSGDKKAANKLKAIETESQLHINPKYQPSRQITSYHRIISASNNDHAADVEYDDRRKLVIRFSEAHKGDFKYWAALDNEIKNGGLEAFVYALLKIDLADFEVRKKPQTTELLNQKIASLDPVS